MPFKSRSQVRWMFAAENRGEIDKGTAEKWAHKTPGGIASLPEKVSSRHSSRNPKGQYHPKPTRLRDALRS